MLKSKYDDIKIGFINDDISLLEKKQNENNDKYGINTLLNFKNKFCILHRMDFKTECLVCGEELSADNYIFYNAETRYIIPEYYFHYICKHDIIVDNKLLEICNNPPWSKTPWDPNCRY